MDDISSEQRHSVEVVVNTSKYDIGNQINGVLKTATKETTTNQTIATDTNLDAEPQVKKSLDTKPIEKKTVDKTPIDKKTVEKKPVDTEPFAKFEETVPQPHKTAILHTKQKTLTEIPKYNEIKIDNTGHYKSGSTSSLSTKPEEETIRSHKTQSHIDYSWSK